MKNRKGNLESFDEYKKRIIKEWRKREEEKSKKKYEERFFVRKLEDKYVKGFMKIIGENFFEMEDNWKCSCGEDTVVYEVFINDNFRTIVVQYDLLNPDSSARIDNLDNAWYTAGVFCNACHRCLEVDEEFVIFNILKL